MRRDKLSIFLSGCAAALVFSLVAWLPVRAAKALTITLNGGGTSFLTTSASDASGAQVSETLNPTALSFSSTSTSVDGLASSESVYTLTNDGFNITFDHSRPSTLNSFGQFNGTIFFSPDQNIDYVASGSYTAVDSDGRRIRFRARLIELPGTGMFESIQQSESTPNESFTLGLSEGDTTNVNTGSLTGTLIAGQNYQFFFRTFIQAFPSTLTSATASGSVSLMFIPEPSTALLLGLGLVGLAARRRFAKTH